MINTQTNFNKSSQLKSTFDRSAHIPPRLDHKGLNVDNTNKPFGSNGMNVVSNTVKIPDWWKKNEKSNMNVSRTDMMASRRRSFIPDKSYDLDGDGFVSNRDYVLSKLFDKDKDGKLNEKERAEAFEGIKQVSAAYNCRHILNIGNR